LALLQGIGLDSETRKPIRDARRYPKLWYPGQPFTRETGSFTVPASVSEERVELAYDRYRKKFGEAMERQGFEVLDIKGPKVDKSFVANGTTDPDRRKYVLHGRVRRRPITFTIDVPDEDVAIYEKAGFWLAS
jgi:hypothetical protein